MVGPFNKSDRIRARKDAIHFFDEPKIWDLDGFGAHRFEEKPPT